MPTPVGHALAGLALGPLFAWRRPFISPGWDLALFVGVSQLPDLDFLPGLLLGRPEAFHHGASHSLGAAALVGLLAWLVGRGRGEAWRWALMAFGLVLAHALIDALGLDYRHPYGVPLAWPLDGRYLTPDWAFFLDVRRGPLGWDVLWHNLKAVGLELAVLGPPAALVLWLWTRRQPAPAR